MNRLSLFLLPLTTCLVAALSDCASIPRERHIMPYHPEAGPAAFAVGQQIGALCGRKTSLNVMQLTTDDIRETMSAMSALFRKYKAVALRPHCEYYREKRHLGVYDETFQTTQWIPARLINDIEKDVKVLGMLQYADVSGTFGEIDDSVVARWSEMKKLLKTGLPAEREAEFNKTSQAIDAYEETVGKSPLEVIFLQPKPPPASDDPVAIVASQLEAYRMSISSSATMFDKLESLFQKGGAPTFSDLNWTAGWTYRKNAQDLAVGAMIAKVHRDDSMQINPNKFKYVVYYGVLKVPVTEDSVEGWRSQLIFIAPHYTPPSKNEHEIVFEHHIPIIPWSGFKETLRLRKLNNRVYILELTGDEAFSPPSYMIFYKDLNAFYHDL